MEKEGKVERPIPNLHETQPRPKPNKKGKKWKKKQDNKGGDQMLNDQIANLHDQLFAQKEAMKQLKKDNKEAIAELSTSKKRLENSLFDSKLRIHDATYQQVERKEVGRINTAMDDKYHVTAALDPLIDPVGLIHCVNFKSQPDYFWNLMPIRFSREKGVNAWVVMAILMKILLLMPGLLMAVGIIFMMVGLFLPDVSIFFCITLSIVFLINALISWLLIVLIEYYSFDYRVGDVTIATPVITTPGDPSLADRRNYNYVQTSLRYVDGKHTYVNFEAKKCLIQICSNSKPNYDVMVAYVERGNYSVRKELLVTSVELFVQYISYHTTGILLTMEEKLQRLSQMGKSLGCVNIAREKFAFSLENSPLTRDQLDRLKQNHGGPNDVANLLRTGEMDHHLVNNTMLLAKCYIKREDDFYKSLDPFR